MYYQYAINEETETPSFLINKHIGYDSDDGYGIMGNDFSKEVYEIAAKKPKKLFFHINSMGGNVQDALDIFDAIQNCGVPTVAIVHGFAYSAAGWIPFAADSVVMKAHAMWMCHLPYNTKSNETVSKALESVANSIAVIISDRSGRNGKAKLSVDEVMALMKEKTFLSGHDCFDKGLCDKLETTSGKRIKNDADIKIIYREEQVALNKHLHVEEEKQEVSNENINILPMLKVLNKLRLAEGSNEDAILAAIANMENDVTRLRNEESTLRGQLQAANDARIEAATNAETFKIEANSNKLALEAANAEKLTLQEQITALNQQKLDIETKLTEIQNKQKEEADAALLTRATDMVQEFANQGKIKDDEETKKGWIDMAIENGEKSFNKVKLQLDTINGNLRVPKPVKTEEIENKEVVPGSDEYFRIQNRERRDNQYKAFQKVAEQAGAGK